MELPVADELAKMIRAGREVGGLAGQYGVKTVVILGHLYRGGYGSDGSPRERRPVTLSGPNGLHRAVRSWLEPWMEFAACKYTDPRLWYPEGGGDQRKAREICAGCPVIERCLEYALLNNEQWGVWGNTSEKQRRRMLKEGKTP